MPAPDQYIMNDSFLGWVNSKFAADRQDNKLVNDNPNKYSAYYHFGTNPLL